MEESNPWKDAAMTAWPAGFVCVRLDSQNRMTCPELWPGDKKMRCPQCRLNVLIWAEDDGPCSAYQ